MKEAKEYDHVGLKACTGGSYLNRTTDKIKKGRKTLNAASGIGLRRGGLTMKVCSFLFWSLIVPIVTFASELWVLKDEDINALDAFQRYAERRVQRFPYHSPNETSFVGLGWMRMENYIAAKKLIFIRTIVAMDDTSPMKCILLERSVVFNNDRGICLTNEYDSPLFNIFKMAMCFGILNELMRMIYGLDIRSKRQWSNLIWKRAWLVEDDDWSYRTRISKYTLRMEKTVGSVFYLIWWQIADRLPALITVCETMAKLVCNASNLKSDDYRYGYEKPIPKICDLCDGYETENVSHLVLHCSFHEEIRAQMMAELNEIAPDLFDTDPDILNILLGRRVESIDPDLMWASWICAGKRICEMYYNVLHSRAGIG